MTYVMTTIEALNKFPRSFHAVKTTHAISDFCTWHSGDVECPAIILSWYDPENGGARRGEFCMISGSYLGDR